MKIEKLIQNKMKDVVFLFFFLYTTNKEAFKVCLLLFLVVDLFPRLFFLYIADKEPSTFIYCFLRLLLLLLGAFSRCPFLVSRLILILILILIISTIDKLLSALSMVDGGSCFRCVHASL